MLSSFESGETRVLVLVLGFGFENGRRRWNWQQSSLRSFESKYIIDIDSPKM